MKTRTELKEAYSNLFRCKSFEEVSLVDVQTVARVISDANYVHLGELNLLFCCFENYQSKDEYEKMRLKNNSSSAFNSVLTNIEQTFEKLKESEPKFEIFFAVYVITCCLFLDKQNIFNDEKIEAFFPVAEKVTRWGKAFGL